LSLDSRRSGFVSNAKATTFVGAIAIGLGVGTLSAFAGGSFDPNLPRGISISKFSVPGQSIQETCIVPKHIAFAEYRKADENREHELCKYNFYESSGTTDSSGAVVVCPKTSSTSAGVLLYDIPDGHGKSELQTTAMCLLFETKNRPASDVKEIAKFKQTDDDRTNAQLMCGACVRSRSHAFAHSICGWRLPRSQWP
jgi:hypothetical protein